MHQEREREECFKAMLPAKDALDLLSGRWKLRILVAVSYGPSRFRQLARDVDGITDRMLSKELKELELNKIISRKEIDAFPPVVEYEMTEHGTTLFALISELRQWGGEHRKVIMDK